MTTESELIALAERVEAATGPNYALEVEIFKAIHPEYAGYVQGRGGLVHPYDGSDQRVLSDVRPGNYTASLDAAMTLVPSDPWLEIRGPRKYLNIPTHSPNFWSANVSCWNHEGQKTGWGATPALALTAAALRARAAAQVSA